MEIKSQLDSSSILIHQIFARHPSILGGYIGCATRCCFRIGSRIRLYCLRFCLASHVAAITTAPFKNGVDLMDKTDRLYVGCW